MKKWYVLFGWIFFNTVISNAQQDSSAWKYLGQDPPGLKPEIFAPGIISGNGRLHCFPSFSSDGKEIIWMKLPPKLYEINYDETWSEPHEISVLNRFRCMFPVHSRDDKRLYFASNNIPGGIGSLDIWYVEKSDTGYSEPINIGSPVNTSGLENQPVFTKSGTIYYTGYVHGKRWDRGILRSKFEKGSYLSPEILSETINVIDTNAIDYTPYIAYDESYLLFCSNRHDVTKEHCRIYISFKGQDDRWSKPIDINSIMNFDYDSRDPYISPDGKYLFFSSGENIYWISSGILNKIKVD